MSTPNPDFNLSQDRDPLTQLGNQNYFQTQFNLFNEEAQLFQQTFLFILFEVDHLQSYADEDKNAILSAIGNRLSKLISRTFIAARLEGDLFGLLCLSALNQTPAQLLPLQQLHEQLTLEIRYGVKLEKFTYRLGWAECPKEGTHFSQIKKQVQTSMKTFNLSNSQI